MSRSVRLVIAVGSFALLCIAYGVWRQHLSLSTIARGMPSNFRDGDFEFKRRVRARFPTGGPENSLIEELRTMGFPGPLEGRDSRYVEINRGWFSPMSGPCDLIWRVIWKVDKEGRVAEVNGLYGGVCL
jgi:hypothetical protein